MRCGAVPIKFKSIKIDLEDDINSNETIEVELRDFVGFRNGNLNLQYEIENTEDSFGNKLLGVYFPHSFDLHADFDNCSVKTTHKPILTDTYTIKNMYNNKYFSGYNNWDKQLRKAKLYHSLKYAQDIVNDFRYNNMKLEIVKVSIEEVVE